MKSERMSGQWVWPAFTGHSPKATRMYIFSSGCGVVSRTDGMSGPETGLSTSDKMETVAGIFLTTTV